LATVFPYHRVDRLDVAGLATSQTAAPAGVNKPASASISSRFIDAMAGAVKSDVDAPESTDQAYDQVNAALVVGGDPKAAPSKNAARTSRHPNRGCATR
jgi:hypothetical protein